MFTRNAVLMALCLGALVSCKPKQKRKASPATDDVKVVMSNPEGSKKAGALEEQTAALESENGGPGEAKGEVKDEAAIDVSVDPTKAIELTLTALATEKADIEIIELQIRENRITVLANKQVNEFSRAILFNSSAQTDGEGKEIKGVVLSDIETDKEFLSATPMAKLKASILNELITEIGKHEEITISEVTSLFVNGVSEASISMSLITSSGLKLVVINRENNVVTVSDKEALPSNKQTLLNLLKLSNGFYSGAEELATLDPLAFINNISLNPETAKIKIRYGLEEGDLRENHYEFYALPLTGNTAFLFSRPEATTKRTSAYGDPLSKENFIKVLEALIKDQNMADFETLYFDRIDDNDEDLVHLKVGGIEAEQEDDEEIEVTVSLSNGNVEIKPFQEDELDDLGDL